ncbi:type II toxin-antitoxin system Phd/YefM family antitoxin [Kribbella sp. NPDC004536]|uniref:type II toxin-antitoxin system Phd/YefM family antitoxin n=1 Tax=Kribbella sp. NPDC004536 TaxID=3364106 RepID=UPI00369F484F
MATVDVRELQQRTCELLRRAEAGEQLTITIAGRPAATLGPVKPGPWRPFDEVATALRPHPDTDWTTDRDLIDQT